MKMEKLSRRRDRALVRRELRRSYADCALYISATGVFRRSRRNKS